MPVVKCDVKVSDFRLATSIDGRDLEFFYEPRKTYLELEKDSPAVAVRAGERTMKLRFAGIRHYSRANLVLSHGTSSKEVGRIRGSLFMTGQEWWYMKNASQREHVNLLEEERDKKKLCSAGAGGTYL